MNGTIYEELKKKDHSKKREKLKIGMAIILSNFLTLFLVLNFSSSTLPLKTKKSTPSKILHANYSMAILPLTILVDENLENKETPVTLVNKSQKIVIAKAYLHEKLPTNLKNEDLIPRYKIEIPDSESKALGLFEIENMMAIPPINTLAKKALASFPKGSIYEVNL